MAEPDFVTEYIEGYGLVIILAPPPACLYGLAAKLVLDMARAQRISPQQAAKTVRRLTGLPFDLYQVDG